MDASLYIELVVPRKMKHGSSMLTVNTEYQGSWPHLSLPAILEERRATDELNALAPR
jgi:hypothetical protein